MKSLGIEKTVSFRGWLSHAEVLKRLRSADVVVLPAIREGGGGVVFEALASGAVPVILDWGGPGDIVHPEVGYKVPPTNEDEVVSADGKDSDRSRSAIGNFLIAYDSKACPTPGNA